MVKKFQPVQVYRQRTTFSEHMAPHEAQQLQKCTNIVIFILYREFKVVIGLSLQPSVQQTIRMYGDCVPIWWSICVEGFLRYLIPKYPQIRLEAVYDPLKIWNAWQCGRIAMQFIKAISTEIQNGTSLLSAYNSFPRHDPVEIVIAFCF